MITISILDIEITSCYANFMGEIKISYFRKCHEYWDIIHRNSLIFHKQLLDSKKLLFLHLKEGNYPHMKKGIGQVGSYLLVLWFCWPPLGLHRRRDSPLESGGTHYSVLQLLWFGSRTQSMCHILSEIGLFQFGFCRWFPSRFYFLIFGFTIWRHQEHTY